MNAARLFYELIAKNIAAIALACLATWTVAYGLTTLILRGLS